MSLDKQSMIYLEEWKERYASYRGYRNNYITVMSISATVWLIALGHVLKVETSFTASRSILSLMVIELIGLATAHVIAFLEIHKLGKRMGFLQQELGMEKYSTTQLLERALVVTGLLSIFVGFLSGACILYLPVLK